MTTTVSTSAGDRTRRLRILLTAHRPRDERESWSVRRTLALLDWLGDPFDEWSDPTHVTGSAIVLDADGRVLLHRHKRLARWLQPGGHVDPGEGPEDAALREVVEETGLAAWHPPTGPRLVHVDVHEGPRGHVHLDLRYLLHADGSARLEPAAGESQDVVWLGVPDAMARGDASLRSAIAATVATAESAV